VSQSDFDRAIALAPGDHDGEARATFDGSWIIGGGVNGGVLMAMGALALRRVLDEDGRHPDPLALTAYFLSPSAPGAVVARTEVLRAGRTMSTGQFALSQYDASGPVERMRGLATFGDLTERAEPLVRSEPAPDMPPPDECLGKDDEPKFQPRSTLLDRMDLRLDPASTGWLRGKPSQEGILRGWVRFADGREPDVLSLLWALDAMPPVAFDLGLVGWTPTLEFTGHLRGHPAPGWLQVVLTTANVAGGLMEEDARIWDSTGRLVALSRQLCAWRLPSGDRE
jgi:acyl-CoA thioesterase